MDSCVCGEHDFHVKINPRQHVFMLDSGQIRSECFPVQNGTGFRPSQTIWSSDSRQLAMAERSLDMVEPNPIHG